MSEQQQPVTITWLTPRAVTKIMDAMAWTHDTHLRIDIKENGLIMTTEHPGFWSNELLFYPQQDYNTSNSNRPLSWRMSYAQALEQFKQAGQGQLRWTVACRDSNTMMSSQVIETAEYHVPVPMVTTLTSHEEKKKPPVNRTYTWTEPITLQKLFARLALYSVYTRFHMFRLNGVYWLLIHGFGSSSIQYLIPLSTMAVASVFIPPAATTATTGAKRKRKTSTQLKEWQKQKHTSSSSNVKGHADPCWIHTTQSSNVSLELKLEMNDTSVLASHFYERIQPSWIETIDPRYFQRHNLNRAQREQAWSQLSVLEQLQLIAQTGAHFNSTWMKVGLFDTLGILPSYEFGSKSNIWQQLLAEYSTRHPHHNLQNPTHIISTGGCVVHIGDRHERELPLHTVTQQAWSQLDKHWETHQGLRRCRWSTVLEHLDPRTDIDLFLQLTALYPLRATVPYYPHGAYEWKGHSSSNDDSFLLVTKDKQEPEDDTEQQQPPLGSVDLKQPPTHTQPHNNNKTVFLMQRCWPIFTYNQHDNGETLRRYLSRSILPLSNGVKPLLHQPRWVVLGNNNNNGGGEYTVCLLMYEMFWVRCIGDALS